MSTYWLKFKLESDATFGRGDGLVGITNAEVQHDGYGLPYMSGKTVKGLLCSACAEIISALDRIDAEKALAWRKSAAWLFGKSGSQLDEIGALHTGPARLPAALRQAVIEDVVDRGLSPEDVLESLTALRRQTAMDPETGAPRDESLRTVRVIVRKTMFAAKIELPEGTDYGPDGENQPEGTAKQLALPLLAACTKALKRAGSGRNRGRGKITAGLWDADGNDVTDTYLKHFEKEVQS